MNPSECAQRAPLGPPEFACTCGASSQISKLLTESEYEVGKEKPAYKPKRRPSDARDNANYTEFEFADDAISLNNESMEERPPSRCSVGSMNLNEPSTTENPYLNVNGKVELPCVEEVQKYFISDNISTAENVEAKSEENNDSKEELENKVKPIVDVTGVGEVLKSKKLDGNYNKVGIRKVYSYCTLPKVKKNITNEKMAPRPMSPPKRITPDGTHIYYWCDLYKKYQNGEELLL